MTWRQLPGRAGTWLAHRPLVVQGLKTAVAAGLAWLLVRQLGGFLADYPYYAPLGAVVAVTNTVARSARDAAQTVLAVSVGAALAFAVRLLDVPVGIGVAVVVGIGTMAAGLRPLRAMGSWVPVSGLFVLLVGAADPVHYPLAYLGLTAMGAAVGVAVNLAVPPLPLLRTERRIEELRTMLADQLDALAEGLRCEDELTAAEWAKRRHDLHPAIGRLQMMTAELTEARRGNWRLGRWRGTLDHEYEQARALHQLALLIDDVASLVVARGHLLRDGRDRGELITPAARTLESMAELLRSLDGPTADPERLEATDEAVQRLATAIREHDAGSRRDGFVAATIVTSVRRALAALAPEELGDQIPSHW
ncbi:FUSC family protein [Nocardioides pantholopis]|uniref:FUSC family protein n=1 Tax=Nocardioides pantholopis TaxID=2483798 RepID=UPI0013E30E61|nr:aromatic acid exporter family protein [Nocardioides pantholopis]